MTKNERRTVVIVTVDERCVLGLRFVEASLYTSSGSKNMADKGDRCCIVHRGDEAFKFG